jgi:hypothetical protein
MQGSKYARSAAALALCFAGASAFAAGEGPATAAPAAIAMAPAQQQEAAAPGAAIAAQPVTEINPAGLPFRAGTYRCELNRQVQVRDVAPDLGFAVLNWDRKDYTLRAVGTRSGALRYEDSASGLVWLVIVGKAMLLDTKRGQQLANECRV